MIFHDLFIGDIDCGEFKAIIDHPLFQRLGLIKQLGLSHLIFRYAQHTRFEHSIGACGRTELRNRPWKLWNIIDKDLARDLSIYGLIHDIGHGPYSHTIEGITAINHDEHGLMILEDLRKTIRHSGGDFDTIEKLFKHKNNFYKAVHDKNLGTEKFDYLERDAFYTNSGRPNFGELPYRVKFMKGELVIEHGDDLLDAALGIQEFYMKMYKNVYLQTNTTIIQHVFQELVFNLLQNKEITEERLWMMTDNDLDAAILNSKQEFIQKFGANILRKRLWPKVAISIKQRRFQESERCQDGRKVLSVFSVGARRMKKLAHYFYKSPKRIIDTAAEIEKMLNLKERSIWIVPITDSHRFKAQQVMVYKENDGISSLEKWRPDGVKHLNEIAQSYMCLRIATIPDYRSRVASKGKEILRFLLSKI